MVNSRHLHSLFLALGCALSGALAAWDGNVNLNKFAVKDASGKIAVLGTEGSWSDKGDVKEHVFDGDPATFFDSIENSSAWTGLDLDRPQMIVGARYVPRTGNPERMVGGKFEGANSPDFSDARTLYTIAESPTCYLVWTNGVECAFVATNAATCARSARAHTTFGVSAVNGSAQSDRISLELPPAPPPPFILFFR